MSDKKPFYKRSWFIVVAILTGIIVIAGILGNGETKTTDHVESKEQDISNDEQQEEQYLSGKAKLDSIKQAKIDAFNAIEIVEFNWNKGGGSGSIGMLRSITFKNNGDWNWKDLKLQFEFKGESGTVLDTQTKVLPIVLKAGETKKINKDINLGFIHEMANKASVSLINAKEMN